MRRLFFIASIALFALSVRPVRADFPPLVDCPWVHLGGDQFKDNGFYVPQYPGNSLSKVTLYLEFPSAGTYMLSLTARAGSYAGPILGTATTSVTATAGDVFYPASFTFASPSVTPQTAVTFQGAIVSGPPGFIFYAITTPAGCPVVETQGTAPPLDSFRRAGVAVVVEGGSADPTTTLQTATIPSVASIHGQNGSFFHTDIWIYDRTSDDLSVTARFRCLTGLSCSDSTATFTVGAFASRTISDVVPTLFGLSETAGALELTVTSEENAWALYTLSRTYSPALPAPTTGASLAALPASAASGGIAFVGIAGSGGNLSTGFRTNAGFYNPQETSANVALTLATSASATIGTTSLTLAPHEATQLNDIFASVGQGSVVTNDALLFVSSTVPIFAFTTVIDNRTGDFVYQGNPFP